MATTTETVQPGQWLRFLNNDPNKAWRHLDEIAPDPFGNADMVVMKFSNGDGDRRHVERLALVDETGKRWWDVSESRPTENVATESTASQWMAIGRLVELIEHGDPVNRVEALLAGGFHGMSLVEIPAEALENLRDALTPGVEVEVIVPALSTGVPGITEVRVANRTRNWKSDEGVPVSRGFLDAHDLVAKADASGRVIVAFVHP